MSTLKAKDVVPDYENTGRGLVLTLRLGEGIELDGIVKIHFHELHGRQVKLKVVAPDVVKVDRLNRKKKGK